MMKREDFLFEVQVEELPPKTLLKLATHLGQQIKDRLVKADLQFEDITFYATPRRLAVLVKALVEAQPAQTIERRGPALNAAFDDKGIPSPACVGFARSVGVTPDALITIKTPQGEWVGFRSTVPGKSVQALLPTIVEEALAALPISKRMRWGAGTVEFIRPVHGIVMLYGDQIIDATILGCKAGRVIKGHRFHAPQAITLAQANDYESALQTKGFVIADFAARKAIIREQAKLAVKDCVKEGEVFISSDALLDEVTGLVEWPQALCGRFDVEFLAVPKEVLISSMQDHQRYFPVMDANKQLLPYFVTISNIKSSNPARVIHGNERVLRARLADAAFFYKADKQEPLSARLERLKGIVFQAKLGTLYEKAERLAALADRMASEMGADVKAAHRAGLLAKADLTTQMVGEFPELQGLMGSYYAEHDGETPAVAQAIKEHYYPRFSGDQLPLSLVGQAVSIADKIDTLVGIFGINQIPTGDKDPFGLRRAALGIIRIMIEREINVDLKGLVEFAATHYSVPLENRDVVPQVLNFLQERMRAWYQERGVTPDVFAAVTALNITNPLDVHARIQAVQAFKQLEAAQALSIANKRVSNILSKYAEQMEAKIVDPALFESEAEKKLAEQLEIKSEALKHLYQSSQYDEALLQLADLRQPIDTFFDEVMVMADDKSKRENRLLLLSKLRSLFLQVADIALLQ